MLVIAARRWTVSDRKAEAVDGRVEGTATGFGQNCPPSDIYNTMELLDQCLCWASYIWLLKNRFFSEKLFWLALVIIYIYRLHNYILEPGLDHMFDHYFGVSRRDTW